MDHEALDVAYRYPFSAVAKRLVSEHSSDIALKYLDMGKRHIESAINEGLEYRDVRLDSVKIDYLMAYLYSRMILSAHKNTGMIKAYAKAEAKRVVKAAYSDKKEEPLSLANELNLKVSARFDSEKALTYDEFALRFEEYLKNAPNRLDYELVNQRISSGTVILDRARMQGFLEWAVTREILKGLPIKSTDLPREVVEYSRGLKFDLKRVEGAAEKRREQSGASEAWIEKLLKTPIADVRHRTVNLILAPYLVNSKNMSVEDATKMITEYIERCKEVDPNTKITSRYIEYQCNYAKKKESRPLSLAKAKELLHGAIDMDAI